MKNDILKEIKSLLPPELSEIKSLVNELLETKPKIRKTNLEYLEREKEITCPIDKSHRIKKNGHKNETQRYWCHDCKKSFSITENSIAKSSFLTYQQFKKFLQCMYDFKSLVETSLEVGISETSCFELQIRIFSIINQAFENKKLKGETQVDEKYIRTSFKGMCKEKMPRASRHDGHTELTSGISKDQVCVIFAIDSYDTIIIKVAGNGAATTEMISFALKDKIEKGSTIITDSKSSYRQFAKDNSLNLIQIPAGQHKFKNYTINDVNELMQEAEIYLDKKKGISSRHLQHHMNFIKYRKILKYTIEYLEINEEMYKNCILATTSLKSNDVYSTEMPFDIEEYKKWYSNRNS